MKSKGEDGMGWQLDKENYIPGRKASSINTNVPFFGRDKTYQREGPRDRSAGQSRLESSNESLERHARHVVIPQTDHLASDQRPHLDRC